ncbi:unnamed protein product [Ostreobium quekettii]|uniref:Uncharacterized protein n=1 Tax=Ostreobium quekettii TaxID=121088 RepID=A0A8S1INV2_9CHLO|nr:unnamed protein product [Ostreobium quekettii]
MQHGTEPGMKGIFWPADLRSHAPLDGGTAQYGWSFSKPTLSFSSGKDREDVIARLAPRRPPHCNYKPHPGFRSRLPEDIRPSGQREVDNFLAWLGVDQQILSRMVFLLRYFFVRNIAKKLVGAMTATEGRLRCALDALSHITGGMLEHYVFSLSTILPDENNRFLEQKEQDWIKRAMESAERWGFKEPPTNDTPKWRELYEVRNGSLLPVHR